MSTDAKGADSRWHHIVLSHYTARGETLFFVDGSLVGKVPERLEPNRFLLGGPGAWQGKTAPAQADYKEWLVYRSALNADEVEALYDGKLLQASLDIYAPLADQRFAEGSALENRAQSLSLARVGVGNVAHAEK